jgi:hypothetical protein
MRGRIVTAGVWLVCAGGALLGQEHPAPDALAPFLYWRGEGLYLGRFDRDGNVWPVEHVVGPSSHAQIQARYRLPAVRYLGMEKGPVYEYRAGRLVRGTMAGSRFVPEANRPVITVTDYRDDVPIYNLPGKLVRAPGPARGAEPPARKGGPGAAYAYVYSFDEDYWRTVAVRGWGGDKDRLLLGTLGPDGDLVYVHGVRPVPILDDSPRPRQDDTGRVARVRRRDGKWDVQIGRLDRAGGFVEDKDVKAVLLNGPSRPREPVYEYRSGRLIPGVLEEGGRFVPDVGGTVLPMETYLHDYTPDKARRVYNLPGRIVKR